MAEHAPFHASILREYDIRGIYADTLFDHDAIALGRAFAIMARRRGAETICVARDGRTSSPGLARSFVGGAASAGLEVIDIGMGATPMLYYAVHELGADGGCMVTGSHNPPNHNGFKMVLKGEPLWGDGVQELGRIAAEDDLAEQEGGWVREVDMLDRYVDRLARDFRAQAPIDVVWDCGNGATGPLIQKLADRIPGRSLVLYPEVDGTFPNHHPDPTEPENMAMLANAVREGGFALGIGFDGDGDRIGVVDASGRHVLGDQLLAILAPDVLERHPGAPVIADVKTSDTVYDAIRAAGGEAIMWKTGHSLIKIKMKEVNSPISGEMSGHIFYKDGFYGHDDGPYVGVRLLDMLARRKETVKNLIDALPRTISTPEIRLTTTDEAKFAVIDAMKARLAEGGDHLEVNTLDGVRVRERDGWWLLRASNTQAVVVARIEARDEAALERLRALVGGHLRALGVDPAALAG